MAQIDNRQDILDVRDIIERYEDLRGELFDDDGNRLTVMWDDDTEHEYETLGALLEELRGYGRNHQWDGDWYPVTLIRDSHFVEYAQEFAEEIGAFNPNASWPANYIDWSAAADALKMDYSSVEFDGVDYWYR